MKLEKYKHIPYTIKPNKNKIPANTMYLGDYEEFNKIYQYAKKHYNRVKPTRSKGISYKVSERFHERFIVNVGNQRFEMVIICAEGCYRFVMKCKPGKNNVIGGTEACRVIYKIFEQFHMKLNKYCSDGEEGLKIKQEIESPHIEVMYPLLLGKTIDHVYHMDFKSSYASRISEAYPEFKKAYEWIYSKRKENNAYFKHILTNSIGCWQSEYCVDLDGRHNKPYMLSQLSKVAINGTRKKILEMIAKLNKAGMIPLLTNTDGIWYYSDKGAYHDKNEGNQLGNWENDHCDCKFLMTSAGAYQYVENGKCETVLRGLCALDATEPDRSKWEFGIIKDIKNVISYSWDEEKGVVKND